MAPPLLFRDSYISDFIGTVSGEFWQRILSPDPEDSNSRAAIIIMA